MRMTMLRILHVDDDPDIRTIVAMALALDPEIEVRDAASGKDALALLDAGEWHPTVVLMDMMMPGLSGIDLAHEIRMRPVFADVPLLFLTARCRDSEVARWMAEGAAAVIPKPFDPLKLAVAVRSALPPSR